MPLDVYNWLLVFVRAAAFLALVPLFSAANVPRQMRLAMAALVAILVSPALPAVPSSAHAFIGLTGLLFREVAAGLTLGFITRMVFFLTDLAGAFISSEMGLNLSMSFNPISSLQAQAPGMVLFYLAAMLMLGFDLHHWFLAAFQRSYDLLPTGAAHPQVGLLEAIVRQTSGLFGAGLLIAAPMMAVSFIITLIFVVLSRAVPQMNVFVESFAFRIMAGLAIFGLSLQLMAQHVLNYLRALPEDMLRVARLLGG